MMTHRIRHGRLAALLDRVRRRLGVRRELFPRDARILDIGVGTTKRGTIGIDLNQTPVVDLQADGTHLPVKTDSVDGVVCYHVVEHLDPDAIQRLADELHRVTRPEGRIYVLVDRDTSREALLAKDPTHVDRYPLDMLHDILAARIRPTVEQSWNLVGLLRRRPLTWWLAVGRGTKYYIEGRPEPLYDPSADEEAVE